MKTPAFWVGAERFCKDAGFDGEDRRVLFALLERADEGALIKRAFGAQFGADLASGNFWERTFGEGSAWDLVTGIPEGLTAAAGRAGQALGIPQYLKKRRVAAESKAVEQKNLDLDTAAQGRTKGAWDAYNSMIRSKRGGPREAIRAARQFLPRSDPAIQMMMQSQLIEERAQQTKTLGRPLGSTAIPPATPPPSTMSTPSIKAPSTPRPETSGSTPPGPPPKVDQVGVA